MNTQTRPRGTRGAAYLRISGDKQDVTSQRQSIERWLKQHGLRVNHWFDDIGSRDLAHKRADFKRLLVAVEAGLLDWIIVDTKDRFGTANASEFGKFICQLRDNDCQLWSVTQGHLSAEDAVTEIMATVDSVRSRDEQVARSQRSIRGKIAGIKRGEWQGGYVPYGFDVVCCTKEGKEKWRVFYETTHERLKVYPDGRRSERYDGKNNFPPKDMTDVLRLAPSRDRKRVAMVRKMFKWLATESISLRGLCTRLNGLGVHPIHGTGWYSSRLGPMLRNPAYMVGATVWNKQAHGRFLEFVDGEYREVQRKKGKTPTGRKRQKEDHVHPDQVAQGIVDQETWEAVQKKLDGLHRPKASPRNSELWLAGLLYCGHCGRRMAGWHQKADKNCPNSYCCATYRQYGRVNKPGCRLHRVRAEVIEMLLDEYLEETGQGLAAILSATPDASEDDLFESLDRDADRRKFDYLKTMTKAWRHLGAAGRKPPKGKPWTHSTMCDALRNLDNSTLAKRLGEKRAEMDREVEQFAKLTNKVAEDAANRRMERLGGEILELEDLVQPLDLVLVEQRRELEEFRANLMGLQKAIGGDSNRTKAEAVGKVVARIVCKFRHEQAGSQNRSILVEVAVEPVEGAVMVATLVDGNPPFHLRDGNARGPS